MLIFERVHKTRIMFKGKIINRFAFVRSRQLGAAAALVIPFLIGIFASSEYLAYFMMLPILVAVLFFFLSRSRLKELNVVKGYLEMDERNILILSPDRDQVTQIPTSDVRNLTFEHTASIPDNKWYQVVLELFGNIKHPTVRFDYDGSRQEYYFTIDSFFMHEKLKAIQKELVHPSENDLVRTS